MKRIEYILLSAMLLFASCENTQLPDDLPISYGYMQFSTAVSTRAQLATDMKEKEYGVLAYKFSPTSNWDGAKSLTTPNLFYNEKVTCGANGVCTYDNMKQWENNNYAFFSYYPYNGNGITLSSQDKTNTPELTYTYGWLDPGSADWYSNGVIKAYYPNVPIFDLMTAEDVNTNGSGDGRVNFNFKHRLCALEILANNYNENIYVYEKNADGTPKLDSNGKKIYVLDADGNKIIDTTVEGANARQKITNLKLTLTGLKNKSMTIPLSMRDGEAAPEYTAGDVGAPTFQISDNTLEIPAFNEVTSDGRGGGVATSVSQLASTTGGYIMLIPQAGSNEGIHGVLDWTELAYFDGDEDGVNNEFTSTIDFEPGRLYQVYINFVGSGITITLIEAGTWDNLDIEHRFE